MTDDITAARKRYAAHLEALRTDAGSTVGLNESPYYSRMYQCMDHDILDADAHAIARDAVANHIADVSKMVDAVAVPAPALNAAEEQHARQALKDIWDAAKLKRGNWPSFRDDEFGHFCGELMAKISTVLSFDFNEEYPPVAAPVVQPTLEACAAESKELRGPVRSWYHDAVKEVLRKHWPAVQPDTSTVSSFPTCQTAVGGTVDLSSVVQPTCTTCGKPATCHGTYEGITGYGCDDCCGHGCEDGDCEPIVAVVQPSDDLLPCPFCGSSIVGPLLGSSIDTDKLGVVGCGLCGANGPWLFDAHELIGRWNQRHAASAVVQPTLEACVADLERNANLAKQRASDTDEEDCDCNAGQAIGFRASIGIVKKHWPAVQPVQPSEAMDHARWLETAGNFASTQAEKDVYRQTASMLRRLAAENASLTSSLTSVRINQDESLAELAAMRSENERLVKELAMWRPLTREEAQKPFRTAAEALAHYGVVIEEQPKPESPWQAAEKKGESDGHEQAAR